MLGDFSLTWGPATPTAKPATSPIDVSNLVNYFSRGVAYCGSSVL